MQKAKYVRDYVAAERKIGQLYIFIRREWITLCVKMNGMPPPRVQVFVHDRMEGKFNQSINQVKLDVTLTGIVSSLEALSSHWLDDIHTHQ